MNFWYQLKRNAGCWMLDAECWLYHHRISHYKICCYRKFGICLISIHSIMSLITLIHFGSATGVAAKNYIFHTWNCSAYFFFVLFHSVIISAFFIFIIFQFILPLTTAIRPQHSKRNVQTHILAMIYAVYCVQCTVYTAHGTRRCS